MFNSLNVGCVFNCNGVNEMNKVIILGRIGKIESKEKFTKLSVVTNSKYKGEQQSQWHDCVAFGKIAEIVDEYLDKGCMVNIIGHLSYNISNKVKYCNIVIENIEIVTWKKSSDNNQSESYDYSDEIPF